MYDYSKAIKKARSFRELIGLSENQPLTNLHMENLFLVLKCLGIKVFTYEELATPTNGSIQELVDIWGPDGAAIIKDNKKFIALNTADSSLIFIERVIWTLIHEIAHFLLGHLNEKDCICLRSDKYDWFESEANVFVANVLMPEKVVRKYIEQHYPNQIFIDVNQLALMKECLNVSWSALIARLDFLRIQPNELSDFLFDTYYLRKEVATENGININSIQMQVYTINMWQQKLLETGS